MKSFFNRINSSKELTILSILIVGVFVLLASRLTYAYFQPQTGESKSVELTGESTTTDKLKFDLSGELNLAPTSTTLPEGGDNLTSEVTATASLIAGNDDNSAAYKYYVYIVLTNTGFTYSDGSTPEIILSVTKNGTEVTSITGLTYGTYSGVSGFDVTKSDGTFQVSDINTITSSSSTDYTTDKWVITLTYINLENVDQSGNYGKSITTKVSMTTTSHQ